MSNKKILKLVHLTLYFSIYNLLIKWLLKSIIDYDNKIFCKLLYFLFYNLVRFI